MNSARQQQRQTLEATPAQLVERAKIAAQRAEKQAQLAAQYADESVTIIDGVIADMLTYGEREEAESLRKGAPPFQQKGREYVAKAKAYAQEARTAADDAENALRASNDVAIYAKKAEAAVQHNEFLVEQTKNLRDNSKGEKESVKYRRKRAQEKIAQKAKEEAAEKAAVAAKEEAKKTLHQTIAAKMAKGSKYFAKYRMAYTILGAMLVVIGMIVVITLLAHIIVAIAGIVLATAAILAGASLLGAALKSKLSATKAATSTQDKGPRIEDINNNKKMHALLGASLAVRKQRAIELFGELIKTARNLQKVYDQLELLDDENKNSPEVKEVMQYEAREYFIKCALMEAEFERDAAIRDREHSNVVLLLKSKPKPQLPKALNEKDRACCDTATELFGELLTPQKRTLAAMKVVKVLAENDQEINREINELYRKATEEEFKRSEMTSFLDKIFEQCRQEESQLQAQKERDAAAARNQGGQMHAHADAQAAKRRGLRHS